MRVGSLFSGIGGFDLGFERAGMETAWFVEREPYCQAVLRKHWPTTPIFDDVCAVNGDNLSPVDLLCGGFPCQDLSYAGRGGGLDAPRSGLWSEFARLIGELRPRYVVVENVPALRTRGLGRVLGEMAAIGYDAEWDCVPASAVGAPHRRDRVWIVGYPHGTRPQGRRGPVEGSHQWTSASSGVRGRARNVADSPRRGRGAGTDPELSHAQGRPGPSDEGRWATEPDVGRVAHGVPSRVDRLRALGNALVPQIAEWIGRQILAYEAGR